MSPSVLFVLGAIVLVLVIIALSAIRVVQQYERGVIFVLGRLIGATGPGLFLVPHFISHMMKVDLRIVTLTVPPQEVITRDNVTIKVTAVVYFYVVDPIAAVVNVVNFNQATSQIGQTTLRNVLGQSELDELLAEREKRAKVIHAEGELLASTQLAQAAAVIGAQPAALQLRYLQTLTEIAVEKNSTIVFPLPIDLVAPIIQILQRHAGEPVHEPLNGSRTNEPSLM